MWLQSKRISLHAGRCLRNGGELAAGLPGWTHLGLKTVKVKTGSEAFIRLTSKVKQASTLFFPVHPDTMKSYTLNDRFGGNIVKVTDLHHLLVK